MPRRYPHECALAANLQRELESRYRLRSCATVAESSRQDAAYLRANALTLTS